jgi:Putative restriction endonuclease
VVVEIRSEGDETYGKIGFYLGLGVRGMLIVHPEGHRVELLRSVDGTLLPVSRRRQGMVRSEVLDAQLATVAGRLRVTRQDGTSERQLPWRQLDGAGS